MDDDNSVAVRLTKPLIRARRPALREDGRVTFRSNSSDWVEVNVTGQSDVAFVVSLVREAIVANLGSAPPGEPPTGRDPERRRRLH